MKITVIHGTQHRGSTWHTVESILHTVRKYTPADVTEFLLPRDMPHFCTGCYSCFLHGENTCPHTAQVRPIVEAMLQSDVVILASPVYALDVTGQMKAFLDHACYLWLSHRPEPAMFGKIGLTVTTTAGAGLAHTAKTLRNSLRYWGMQKILRCSVAVSAMRWDDVPEKARRKINRQAERLGKKLVWATQNARKLRNPLLRSLVFHGMAHMQKKNEWNPTDRAHWEKQGWLNGGKPYGHTRIKGTS